MNMKKILNVKMIMLVLVVIGIVGCSKEDVPVKETDNETVMEEAVNPAIETSESLEDSSIEENNTTDAEDYYYSEENGEIIIESYMGNSEKVVVPAEIDGCPVTTIQYEAFSKRKIVEIELPDGIKTIQRDAFMFCEELEKVVLGSTVETIEESAFAYCKKLYDINLPESISNIGDSAFAGCNELKDVLLPEGITEIPGGMFFQTGINEIEIPEGVVSLGAQSFCDCKNLKRVVIPSSVTEIESDAFANNDNVIIVTPSGSAAETFAKEQNIPVENN